jgi:hypothetical protein
LPGDYDSSGTVDAGDYIVWRQNDVRADGSGPTPGVPDGVVDQLDYAFWRANFGEVGVPGGGGSGAAAAGELDSADATYAPSQSVPLATEPIAAHDDSNVAGEAGDIVLHAWTRTSQPERSSTAQSSQASAVFEQTDLLLLAARSKFDLNVDDFGLWEDFDTARSWAAIDEVVDQLEVGDVLFAPEFAPQM